MGPTLFLVFINDRPNEVLSRIGIFADDTTLYSSLGKSVFLRRLNRLVELDLACIMEWSDRWLVTAMPLKRNCSLSIAIETLLVPVEMSGIELPAETSFR